MPEAVIAGPRYSDAAKRCSDIITLHAVCGNAGQWAAIRLADGDSDGCLYDSRAAAIEHQLRPEYCTFVLIPPSGMAPREAEVLLAYWRQLVDANVRDDRPDQPLPMIPLLARDRRRQLQILKKGHL